MNAGKFVKDFKALNEKSKLTAEDLNRLRLFLVECCNAFYRTEEKMITDEEYDELNYIYESYTDELVSGTSGNAKISHKFEDLMGTLKKVNSIAELKEWFQETYVARFGSGKVPKDYKIIIWLSNKLDGNSILLEYAAPDGMCCSATTRGKDGEGEDIFHIFKGTSIPYEITENIGIKYEAMVLKSNLEAISQLRGKELVDARSAISGMLHRDDGKKYRKYITLSPLDTSEDIRTSSIEFCQDLASETKAVSPMFQRIEGTIDEVCTQIKTIYDRNSKDRLTWDYMVDGLVIEYALDGDRKRLGWHKGSSVYPKFAIALKYPHIEKSTKLIRYEFDFGPTGRVTPCIVFDPVVINGRTYQRTSVANYKRFKELNLGKRARLSFQLRNDVLGYLDKLVGDEQADPIPFLKVCPHCGEDIVINEKETYAYCVNKECNTHVLGQLIQWFVKLGLKGVAESTLQKLIDAELVLSIPDLYTFDMKKAAKVPGLGDTSVKELRNLLNSKQPKDYEVLAVACPEGIGRTILKPFFEKHRFTDIIEMDKDEIITKLINMEGIQITNAEKIFQGLCSELVVWAIGEDCPHFTIQESYKEQTGGKALKISTTGKLNTFTNRDAFIEACEAKGYRFSSSVGETVDFLVTNDTSSGSAKNKKAKDCGVAVISEADFVAQYLT